MEGGTAILELSRSGGALKEGAREPDTQGTRWMGCGDASVRGRTEVKSGAGQGAGKWGAHR